MTNEILYLCRSLGLACYKHSKTGTWTHKGVTKSDKYWRLTISGDRCQDIPTKIPRKRATNRIQKKDALVTGFTVESIGKGDYYGLTLDGNSRYFLGDCTVTHNSRSAFALSELARELNPNIKKTLVLVKAETIEKHLKHELMFQCTKGEYIPANYKELSENERTRKQNRLINKFYIFDTFQQFANKVLKVKNDHQIKRDYSNRVIIIDEAHNLRIKDKKTKVDVYQEMHRFLHLVENVKIMLMSATPIQDVPMNLLQ